VRPFRTPRRLAGLLERVREQLDVVIERDPSVRSRSEALLHPTVVALLGYRLGHRLYRRGAYRSARALCMLTRLFAGGIEIHPGALIGRRLFIDHGCGVVIGETAVIGDDVSLFHQVTLGSTGWWNDRPDRRRHPKLGNGVTVGVGATLLGSITIGDNALIGALALVLSDVPAGALVHAPKATIIPAAPPRPRVPVLASGDEDPVDGGPQ
jgi:serine O-acetyltransferase